MDLRTRRGFRLADLLGVLALVVGGMFLWSGLTASSGDMGFAANLVSTIVGAVATGVGVLIFLGSFVLRPRDPR